MDQKIGRMDLARLNEIIRKVTRGRWRVIATCMVTDDDIQQDLLLDAFRDPVFAKTLNTSTSDMEAATFACGYLNRAWHRRKKSYLADWQRLH